ncbi:hypothetical protein C922_05611 [Plasmodium inui San Antonio 1]|uniref:Uncharacterized protein n=1 Tax=Plasmodium inui San Antonio 1 TaxID=1237626 RepID=W6ZSZ8_9APIC|nr:hypothetical protein C922_05611 [Plasmodium inui San Antonio 1]EUD64007.1 hypothetical protein C922_05611 [Plasmodium inui San Antonio 1]
MSSSGLNSLWKLTSWADSAGDKWGYPPPPARTSQCAGQEQYCYQFLFQGDRPRWGQLDQWIHRKMLKNHPYEWNTHFDPHVSTGLPTLEQGKELSWGQFLHRVLEKVAANSTQFRAESTSSIIWNKDEWNSVLGQSKPNKQPLDQFPSGRKLLFVLMCIITGLVKDQNAKPEQFPRRGRLCNIVDTNLNFLEEQWNTWIKDHHNRRKEEGTRCSRVHGYDACQNASIALILSIYKSMKDLCPSCGPYRMNNWIVSASDENAAQGKVYCTIGDSGINCEKSLQDNKLEGILILRDGELTQAARPGVLRVVQKLDERVERIRREEENRNISEIKEGQERSDILGFISASGELQSPSESPKERISPNNGVTKGPELTLPQEARSLDELPSTVPPRVASERESNLGHGLESFSEDSRDSEFRDEDALQTESTGLQQPEEREQYDEVLGSSDLRERFPWALIGGVAGAVFLAVGGGYGLWRIFSRPKRRVQLEVAYRGSVAYGVGYR